jgi:hypothetical protein
MMTETATMTAVKSALLMLGVAVPANATWGELIALLEAAQRQDEEYQMEVACLAESE